VFEPVNDLERLLMVAAGDPAQRPAFGRALLASEAYVSPTGPPDEAGRVPGVRSVALTSGEAAAALFTSPEQLTAALFTEGSEQALLMMANNGRALLEWLRPGPVALNPGADYGVVWSREDLAALLDGMVTTTLDQPVQLLLTHPAQRPDALIKRLTAAFRDEPTVRGAWLMSAIRGDQLQPTWMVGVDHAGDWTIVQAALRKALDGFAFDRPLDVIDLSNKPHDTLRSGVSLLAASAPPTAPKKRRLFGLSR